MAAGLCGPAVFLGRGGYTNFGQMNWWDAFYNASMILSGGGPAADPAISNVTPLHLFAGFYALFSGVTFITMVGVLLAPAIQRFLHKFHLELASPHMMEIPPHGDSAAHPTPGTVHSAPLPDKTRG